MNTTIDWNYPQPRAGLAGALDRFFGPGTTRAEAWLQGIFSVAAGVALPVYAFLLGFDWTPVQYLIATLLAFDIVGGIVTNATPLRRPSAGITAKGRAFEHILASLPFTWSMSFWWPGSFARWIGSSSALCLSICWAPLTLS